MPETGPARAAPADARGLAFDWLRRFIRQQWGIAFSDEQSGVFRVRIEGLCRDLGLTLDQLQTALERGDRARTLRLLDAISTNYTFFFREPEMFEVLRARVFPALPRGAPLRIWSAAASSGDEAYSIAIQARECLGQQASRVRILGTDVSPRQLELAERGVYRREQLRPIGAERLARWFVPAEGDQLQICDQLREMCIFRRLNLLQRPWPFEQKFHVIFLRNVLYYFEPATRRELLEACYDAVERNGFLITSLTEPMGELRTRWTALAPALYRRGWH